MRETKTDAASGSRLFTTAGVSLVLAVLAAGPAMAAELLFPEPLHLTREVSDPISGTTVVVDEYCHGNRIAAVQDSRTTVVDYERDEITTIDRARETYSVASFETHAATLPTEQSAKARAPWNVTSVAPGALVGGRATDRFLATREGTEEISQIELALDRQVRVTRAGLEALLGSSWPSPSGPALEVIDAALGSAAVQMKFNTTGDAVRHPLPIEQRTTYGSGGESLVFSNVVVRVGSELAPSDLVAIPAGFRRVEDVRSARARMLRELDSLFIPGSVQP